MKRLGFLLTILIVCVLTIISFFLIARHQKKQITVSKTPTPQAIESPTPSISVNPSPSGEANIHINSPQPNQTVKLPIVISGEARVFENQLNYRVRDVQKNVILEGGAYANSPDIGQFGDYKIQIDSLPTMKANALTLEIFDYSAKDGQEIDRVTIPVTFDPENSVPIKIFFGSKQAPAGKECTNMYPVERHIAKTQAVARTSVTELLKGPFISEKNSGYYTSINEGVKIQKITIENGVARVDFDKRLEEEVGGSCKVTAIRTQITQTLKQFPTVKEIIISIDGRTEDILQP